MYLSICLRLMFVKNYSYEKVGGGGENRERGKVGRDRESDRLA